MKRPISRKAHGIAELAYIPLTAFSPELLNFKNDAKATTLARVMGGAMLGSALMTKAEWGLFKTLPFKAHLAADVVLSAAAVAAPWLFKVSNNSVARNTFIFIGVSSFIIGGLLTQRKDL